MKILGLMMGVASIVLFLVSTQELIRESEVNYGKMYRVEFYSKITGFKSHGNWFTNRATVFNAVMAGNLAWPELHHRIGECIGDLSQAHDQRLSELVKQGIEMIETSR